LRPCTCCTSPCQASCPPSLPAPSLPTRRDDGAATQESLADLNGQFILADHRPVQDIVMELMREGYVPSWCTACYRKGRTGEHFMKIAKAGNIHNFCHPNSLFTLQEYLVGPRAAVHLVPSVQALADLHSLPHAAPPSQHVACTKLHRSASKPPPSPRLPARTTTAARRRGAWARS
jgi:hypothetical protein